MENYDSKSHVIEHPIVSTITNEIPIIRSISNYWRETIRQSRENRLTDFLTSISTRIASLEEKSNITVEKSHLASSDYFNTIEQLTEFAIKTNDSSKIEYLKRFAVSYSTDRRPDINLKELYLGLINQLSGMHFVTLEQLFFKQRNLSELDLISLLESPDRDESVCLKDIAENIHVDEELIRALFYSLSSIGLIEIKMDKISNPYVVLKPLGQKLMSFLDEAN